MTETNGHIVTADELAKLCTSTVETSIGTFKIRRVATGELIAQGAYGPIATLPVEQVDAAARARLTGLDAKSFEFKENMWDEVCIAGVLEPRLHKGTDDKPGSFPVRLLGGERQKIAMAILRLSGMTAEAGSAAAFRGEQGASEPAPGASVETAGAPH
jgi:hypothetical protein